MVEYESRPTFVLVPRGSSGVGAEVCWPPPGDSLSISTDDAHRGYTTTVHETADALRAALREHGLDLPGLSVEQGRVDLGDVTVATADRLARLLGAPMQKVERSIEEWPETRQVMRRLGKAFAAATDGGFLDLYFHHDCVRCDRDAALTLGAIKLREAQRLLSAVRLGAGSSPRQ